MKYLNNLSFRRKLLIPLVLMTLVTLVIAVIGIRNITVMDERASVIAKEYLPGLNFIVQADRDLYQAQVAERSMIFVDVQSDAYKTLQQQHGENIEQAHRRINQFGDLTQSARARAMVAEFNRLFAEWKKTTEEIESQRSSNTRMGRTTAIDLSFGPASEQFESARNVIDQLTELVEAGADAEIHVIDETADMSRTVQMMSMIAGLVLCCVVGVVFPRVVTGPLQQLLDRVEDISHGEGDLTARVEVAGRDEIGKLGAAFNVFLEKLQGLIMQVQSSTDQVTAAAGELSSATAMTSAAARDQHSATDQLATAVTEMSATVQDVARNTHAAASIARDTDQHARQGQQVVSEAIHAIEALAADVERTSAVIQELERDSETIGGVLDVIRGVAEQTNLLALNAAIEAARAGEQGRGFAVVADEVRTLASRTQHSTREIQEMIENLQKRASNAVSVMDVGRNKARDSVEKAAHAGEALQAITAAVTQISDMNTQIASAAEEQTAVTEDISRNVVGISTIAEGNSDNAGRTMHAGEELATLADQLQRLVGQFKVHA